MTTYLKDERPPTCLHILGQGLVNSLHAEGKALQSKLAALQYDIEFLRSSIKNDWKNCYCSTGEECVHELEIIMSKHFP